MVNCPICSGPGEDLVFAFYCNTGGCQNFRKRPVHDIEQRPEPMQAWFVFGAKDPRYRYLIKSGSPIDYDVTYSAPFPIWGCKNPDAATWNVGDADNFYPPTPQGNGTGYAVVWAETREEAEKVAREAGYMV